MSEAISTAITTMTGLVGDVFTIVSGNPLIMLFVGTSVLGAAIGIVRRLTKGRV